jgi:RNA polymerase-associated protein
MNDNNRHAAMTVYSDPTCPFSHRARIVLYEKNLDADIINIGHDNWPEDVLAINPSAISPTLIDRDIALFDSNIIISSLEERFLQPALMPNDPVSRAKMRLMLHQIDNDWYAQWNALAGREKGKVSTARRMLQEDLTVLAPLFAQNPYFMNKEFSLLDCSLAPLLWRLPILNIKLPHKARAVEEYAERIFERDSFQASLSEFERAMRP